MSALLVAALTVAAWLAGPAVDRWQQGRFAEALADRALRSEIQESRELIRSLGEQGPQAIEPLVRLAASQRAEIAGAAQACLSNQAAAWELQFKAPGDAGMLAEQVERLAAALGRHASELAPAGQQWAGRLARRMAAYAEHFPAERAWVLLANCDHVLATGRSPFPAGKRPATSRAQGTENFEPGSARARSVTPRELMLAPETAPTIEAMDALPTVSPEPLADLHVAAEAVEALSEPPAKNDSFPSARPLNPLRQTLASAALPPSAPSPQSAAPVEAAPLDVPSPQENRRAVHALRLLSDRELLVKLESSTRFERLAIRQVLRERGYSDALLSVITQVSRHPPRERRAALDRLGSLPAADARRLLRWFVTDDDADVRLQALTLLATTADPQLPEMARQRAIEDRDPRVAALATQIMRQK